MASHAVDNSGEAKVARTGQEMNETLVVLPLASASRYQYHFSLAMLTEVLKQEAAKCVRVFIWMEVAALRDDDPCKTAHEARVRSVTNELYAASHPVLVGLDRPTVDVVVLGAGSNICSPQHTVFARPSLSRVYVLSANQQFAADLADRRESMSLLPCTVHSLDQVKAVSMWTDARPDFFECGVSHLATSNSVVLGGTFDHLHAGHKRLLTAAAAVMQEGGALTIGVTSDKYLAKKSKSFQELIEPVQVRIARVREFLDFIRPGHDAAIVPIDDAAGPTITDPSFEAIVGSSESMAGCMWVNSQRKQRGMSSLRIILVERNDEQSLSSTAIRRHLAENSTLQQPLQQQQQSAEQEAARM